MMKDMFRKLFCVLLSFLLVCGIFSLQQVSAEEEKHDADTISATIEYINPVYGPSGSIDSIHSGTDADIQAVSIDIHESVIEHIREELKKRSETISVKLDYSSDYSDVAHYLMDTAIKTHTGVPTEGDYLRYQYGRWGCDISGNHINLTYTFTMEYYTDAEQEAAMDTAVANLIETLGVRNKNDYQKVKAVYDWIADNVEYEYDYETVETKLIYSGYGALVNRLAVCQGYAVLFYRMMLELGVDCRVVTGTGNNEAHAWNIVKMKDKYYLIDSTWAATANDKPSWFLRGTSYFPNHTTGNEFGTAEFRAEYPIDRNNYVVTDEDLITDDVCQGAVLSDKSLRLKIGNTYTLSAQVLPDTFSQNVTWSSDNTEVATVSQSGVVTAIAEGTAKITAAAEAGGKNGVCAVTVYDVHPDDGTAYIIKVITDTNTNWGDMIFFRSYENYEADKSRGTYIDIYGNEYDGFIFSKGAEIEGDRCEYPDGRAPWYGLRNSIMRIYVAENQVIHVKNMTGWFFNFMQLKSFDSRGFDTSACRTFASSFADCQVLENADLSHFDTSSAVSFSGMFWRCKKLSYLNLSNFNTDKCTNISEMFNYCPSLRKLDLSSFNTENMSGGMAQLFYNTTGLNEIKLGPKFTVWTDDAYVSAGTWRNGDIVKTHTELYEEYPSHAAEWAGTWKRDVPVKGVSVSPTSLTLTVDDESQLTATVSPSDAGNKEVTWESSDASVASVDANGKVKGVKAGSAVITVKTKEGGFTASCNVTVKNKPVQPSEITLSKTSATVVYGGTIKLTATVLPSDAENKTVKWKSADSSIVSVDSNGTVTGKGMGVTAVTAETVNGLTASCEIRVLFKDVANSSQYFYEPVYWAVDNGITVGAGGAGRFSPNNPCTREQIVTFLWRLMDEPEPKTESDFTDVEKNAWYYKPITWAYENHITTGLNDGTGRFGVGQPCTREQCVTFLYRAADSPEVTSHTDFTDVSEDKYYYDSISWAASKGITVGLNDGTGRFGVGQKCTRAMIVTFLYRYAHLE